MPGTAVTAVEPLARRNAMYLASKGFLLFPDLQRGLHGNNSLITA